MGAQAEQTRPDRPGPADARGDAEEKGRPAGPARRRTFMAGRRTADGSRVWFFPEDGDAVVVPFPGPWTLSLVVRTN